jgi:hypothetical protein
MDETKYTKKDLVKFGNFLLSEERKKIISKENKRNVTDADICNAFIK